jgi:sugar lactone lactonase YvrE
MGLAVIAASTLGHAVPASATATGFIETVAGGGVGDGTAAVGAVVRPTDVAFDGAGNMFIADASQNRVRKVDPSGTITTIAGTGESGFSGDGGPATAARLAGPRGVAVDGSDNVYVADTGNYRIRKVSADGVITTIAGGGSPDDVGSFTGPATRRFLPLPVDVAFDPAGLLYIAVVDGQAVWRLERSGDLSTYAGGGVAEEGPARAAALLTPVAIAFDSSANLYVADSQAYKVKKVTQLLTGLPGTMSTVAGTGESGYSSDGGSALQAALARPSGVAADASGNFYISDGSRVRTVSPSGTIGTLGGAGGEASGLAFDTAGRLNAAVAYGSVVRVTSSLPDVVAGALGLPTYTGDGGPATSAFINRPTSVVMDGRGNTYLAEHDGRRVRRINAHGVISTFAGSPTSFASGDGGPATSAFVYEPYGVAIGPDGGVYISEQGANRVRRVDVNGVITTVAGNGSLSGGFGGDGGPATAALLNGPQGIAVDASGNVFIADSRNNRVRKIDTSGTITTVAGTGQATYSGDGGPATSAALQGPEGIAVDAHGALYVADFWNYRVRIIDPTGRIRTVAGNGSFGTAGDGGPATSASMFPSGLAVDSAGNLFITDWTFHRVRRVDTTGTITTVAGGPTSGGFYGDGGSATAAGISPVGVAVDAAGDLVIADRGNDRIRSVGLTRAGSQLTYTGPSSAQYGDSVLLSASLATTSGAPLANRPVALSVSDHRCTGVTDAAGMARCSITADLAPGAYAVAADFAGDSAYAPATTSGTLTVVAEVTRLTYTGDTLINRGGSATLSAFLADDDGTAVAGRVVTLALTGRPGTQTCSATSGADGRASCSIATVVEHKGPATVTATFAGDALYIGSSTMAPVTIA